MSSQLPLNEQLAAVRALAARFGPDELEAFRDAAVEYSRVSDPIAIFREANNLSPSGIPLNQG